MNIIRNIRVMKFVMDGMMLTKVSRMIFKLACDRMRRTILIILNALTTVAAVEKLDPELVTLRRSPMSVPMTTRQSKTFQPE